MAIKTILFATDGTPRSVRVCRIAADLAWRTGADLHLLYAWTNPAIDEVYPKTPGIPSAVQREKARARAIMRDAIAEVKMYSGNKAIGHIRHGIPVFAIHQVALEVDADLVVVGESVTNPIARFIRQAKSEPVIEHVDRPVLVVKNGLLGWPPTLLLAFDDGTEESKHATTFAFELAHCLEAEVHVVRVVAKEDKPEAVTAQQHKLRDYAASLAKASRVPWTSELLTGSATPLLRDSMNRHAHALVVLGTRASGAIPGAHIGSVATRVLRSARTQVLVVPSPVVPQAVRLIGRKAPVLRSKTPAR